MIAFYSSSSSSSSSSLSPATARTTMDGATPDYPCDDFGDGDFPAFDGECPDNLSISIDNLFAILDEEAPAPPPPLAATTTRASQVDCRSFYHDESSSGQVQMDNDLKLQLGHAEPLALMGELTGELGSCDLDISTPMCLVDCEQEVIFGSPFASEDKLSELQINSDPVKMDSKVYHVSDNLESKSMMSCPSSNTTHRLNPSTEENDLSIMDLCEGSFDSLLNGDIDQQLQGNMPNYNVPSKPAVVTSLVSSQNSGFQHDMNLTSGEGNAPMQIRGENLDTGIGMSAYGTATGSSLIPNAENSNIITADPDTMTQYNFYSKQFQYSSMFPYEILPDVFSCKMNTTGADIMQVSGNNLTSHLDSATDIPDNGWMGFFPSSCLQSSVNHKVDVLVSLKDEAEKRQISARSSCTSEMDFRTGVPFRTLSACSPNLHFDEILKDTKTVWNHQMDTSFRSESSSDSSPIPSSRNSTSGDHDMPKQSLTNSEMNVCSKRESTSWENDNNDRKLALVHRQQNRYFKGSNFCLQKYPTTNSINMDDDADICVLDEISCPAKPPLHLPLIKPYASLEQSGFGDSHRIGFGASRLKLSDEMLNFRLALEDLSQPKSEANPPDGFLAVPLLRHQRIALSWMIQKETRSVHCSGGILADDQGLGKTVSTIALILTERSPPSDSYPSTAKQDKSEAFNLDDDEDNDSSGLDGKKRARVSSSSLISGSEMKDSSLGVVKSRPAAGTLVVCPTSVLRQWADELRNKVTKEAKLSFLIYHGSNRTKDPDVLAKFDVVLTTYAIVSMEVPKQSLDDKDEEKMKSDPSGLVGVSSKKRKTSKANMKNGNKMEATFLESARPLAKVRWFRVILDEAQSIKNFRTHVARACWGLRAKRRWCLSGTPIQNAIDDLYSYFRFLRFEPFSFYKSFCSIIKTPISRSPVHGYKKLQAVLKAIMLRRTKGTLIDGKPIIALPPKTVNLKKVDFSNDERSFYSILEAESREQFQVYAAAGTVKQNYVNILLMLLRLRQACDHPLLVKGHESNSLWKSSLEIAKGLPKQKQKDLLSCLEVCSAICTICNDSPEDAVISVCGHIFCNQCICGHLTGDENICPSPNCTVKINVSSVFSKSTLSRSISDLPSEFCGLDTKDAIGNTFSSDSSKIKAALEILRSIPKYECPLQTDSVKSEDEVSEKSDIVGDDSLLSFSDEYLGEYSLTTDTKISTKQRYPTCLVSEKAIIFSQWTGMLDLLEVPLKESSIEYRRLDGTMSIAARDKAVKDFNTLPEVTVMIMSLKAASLGLNMVAACHVLLLDLWWNPTTEDQAIDRAHRIGQTRPVTVSRLTIRDTVEDRILSLQEKKREMVASAFGEDESGSRQTRLTVDDLNYLFGF